MKTIQVSKRSEGVDTDELQKRIQGPFNRYKASVSVKDTVSGIVIRISSVPRAKVTFSELKEMYTKVDRIVDGTYSDIFEVRASWVEVNSDKGIDLVLDYVFEGEG